MHSLSALLCDCSFVTESWYNIHFDTSGHLYSLRKYIYALYIHVWSLIWMCACFWANVRVSDKLLCNYGTRRPCNYDGISTKLSSHHTIHGERFPLESSSAALCYVWLSRCSWERQFIFMRISTGWIDLRTCFCTRRRHIKLFVGVATNSLCNYVIKVVFYQRPIERRGDTTRMQSRNKALTGKLKSLEKYKRLQKSFYLKIKALF